MDIFKILNNDLDGLDENEREFALEFTEKLKEELITELVDYEANNLITKLKKDKDLFMESIESIFVNGVKGYNKLPMQLLINIYLEKVGDESFIKLVQKIS